MTSAAKQRPSVALIVCAMALVTASTAGATHPRVKGATPVRASLVPAQNACAAPNRTHGPPLAFPSCDPPVQSSNAITVGTPDANGAAANSVGFIRISTIVGVPGPPDDADVRFIADITDVRCRGSVITCGSPNAADGLDYTGEVEAMAQLRITDHFNTAGMGSGDADPATVVDLPFPMTIPCAATMSNTIGSTCAIDTTVNTVYPGAFAEGKRTQVEIAQLRVQDGGSDGTASTQPNGLFAVQGVFVP